MAVNTEQVLFNIFYDMQSQGYEPYVFADIAAAAVAAPGKPLWIRASENLSFRDVRTFYREFLKDYKNPLSGIISAKRVSMTCAAIHGGGFSAREIISYYLPEPPSGKFYSTGRLRKAMSDDVPMIKDWLKLFFEEAMESEISTASETDTQMINENTLYIWQDGSPSAMGMLYCGSYSTARINLIYTPKEMRRQGYATAMVRALSEAAFQMKKTPVLYALAENTAANNLYKSIGFKEAGRLMEVLFNR